jgi:uncharacterized coiled-coil protein SlyX
MENAMPPQTLENRVEKLEERVTILEQLPARVDALGMQISQLRDEMTAGFSAISGRCDALEKTLRDEIRGEIRGVNERIDGVNERIDGVNERIDGVDVRIDATGVRIDAMGVRIGGLEERLSTQMRVLHEDVIARLQLIQEGQPRRKRRS